jgi:hypothetical protein
MALMAYVYHERFFNVNIYLRISSYTRAKTLDEFADSEGEIRRAAFDCLGRFELKKKVRLIGVRISNLEKVGDEGRD